ncbi:MAG: hypothetical protein HKM24_04595 [Gammaproteobacteria bacterium]|nr:hypothetical protein [Gammaproteobacteria bacterium]
MTIDIPVGPVTMRAIDRRTTMGYWLGKLEVVDGKPLMVDWERVDVEKDSPTDEWILAQRKGE